MDINTPLSNLKIDSPNKYILYLSGVIFILSLFFEVKSFNRVTIKALIFIISSLVVWLVGIISGHLQFHQYIKAKRGDIFNEELEKRLNGNVIFQFIFFFVCHIIAFIVAFRFI